MLLETGSDCECTRWLQTGECGQIRLVLLKEMCVNAAGCLRYEMTVRASRRFRQFKERQDKTGQDKIESCRANESRQLWSDRLCLRITEEEEERQDWVGQDRAGPRSVEGMRADNGDHVDSVSQDG